MANIDVLSCAILTFLSYRLYPLKILKFRSTLFLFLVIFLPFLINNSNSFYQIFVIQFLILATALDAPPANAIFIKHIPVLRRMTATSFIYALSRAMMYVITSFGLVYLTEFFGYYGLWVVAVPVTIGYIWAVRYFDQLDRHDDNVVLKKKENADSYEKEQHVA